jgi:hypothetical protein
MACAVDVNANRNASVPALNNYPLDVVIRRGCDLVANRGVRATR